MTLKKHNLQTKTKVGKNKSNLDRFFVKSLIESFVSKEKRLPNSKEIDKIAKSVFTKNLLEKMSKHVIRELNRSANRMLSNENLRRTMFEERLYNRWRVPLNLLECLIKTAIESGEDKKKRLYQTVDSTNKFQRIALIKIHARAIQIANEILTLLKSGYSDGANSRWRSIYELVIIAFFLRNNADSVSKRYIEHDVMKRFKEAEEYQKFYKKLGYPPFGRKFLINLKKEHAQMLNRYGKEFEYNSGYEWIPESISKNWKGKDKGRRFKNLEKSVGLSKWRPFYSMSSNAIHGGARGFFRLGLINQSSIHLVGPSNYGLADSLQNTAISLAQVTTCLLNIEPTIEDCIILEVMTHYTKQIGLTATKIQKTIEKEENKIHSTSTSTSLVVQGLYQVSSMSCHL